MIVKNNGKMEAAAQTNLDKITFQNLSRCMQ